MKHSFMGFFFGASYLLLAGEAGALALTYDFRVETFPEGGEMVAHPLTATLNLDFPIPTKEQILKDPKYRNGEWSRYDNSYPVSGIWDNSVELIGTARSFFTSNQDLDAYAYSTLSFPEIGLFLLRDDIEGPFDRYRVENWQVGDIVPNGQLVGANGEIITANAYVTARKVPEPTSFAILSVGLFLMGLFGSRNKPSSSTRLIW